MNTVTLELNLAEDIFLALQSAGLHRDELGTRATRDMAVQLYAEGRLSLGKAARLAGMSIQDFWPLLNSRGVPVFHYTDDDYELDMEAVRWLTAMESKPQ